LIGEPVLVGNAISHLDIRKNETDGRQPTSAWPRSAWGQKAKYSLGADIFRFTPKTGHGWKPRSCPFRAKGGRGDASQLPAE
jgi:hypothetical protein